MHLVIAPPASDSAETDLFLPLIPILFMRNFLPSWTLLPWLPCEYSGLFHPVDFDLERGWSDSAPALSFKGPCMVVFFLLP